MAGNVLQTEMSQGKKYLGMDLSRYELVQVLQGWTCPICDERRIGKNLNEV